MSIFVNSRLNPCNFFFLENKMGILRILILLCSDLTENFNEIVKLKDKYTKLTFF